MNKIETLMMASAIVLSSCQNAQAAGNNPSSSDIPLIGKSEIIVENGLMTPEVLQSFGRVSDVVLSPDKKKILYGVTYVNIPQNKSNRELFEIGRAHV